MASNSFKKGPMATLGGGDVDPEASNIINVSQNRLKIKYQNMCGYC